jgi:pimeloyl-ACP methyl ester carboxylesterase
MGEIQGKEMMEMPRVTVNGATIHYEEAGKGPEAVVFSHSYLVDNRHFRPQMEALKGQYRCLAFDHRGHGGSEVTEGGYDMENLYTDATEFIKAVQCAPCHFVGLSTGGFIGLRIALRKPELLKSLILMDTSAEAEPEENFKQYKMLMFIVRWIGYWPVIGRVMPLFFAKKFLNDPTRKKEVQMWKQHLMANDKKAVVKFGYGIFGRSSVYEELPNIKTPTLVIVGKEDIPTPVAKAERIAERIPGAKLVIIPDAGHLCTVEEPEAVNKAIEDFLKARS